MRVPCVQFLVGSAHVVQRIHPGDRDLDRSVCDKLNHRGQVGGVGHLGAPGKTHAVRPDRCDAVDDGPVGLSL